jgi:hypothetical protein
MLETGRLLSHRVRCFTAIVLMSVASFASQRAAAASGDVDPKTGIKFPAQIGSFIRKGPIDYDPLGYPEATYLLGRMAFASVFYYKEAPFLTEYANARAAVKIKTPSARLISDNASNLHPGGRRSVFSFQETFLGQPNVKVLSELLMFPNHDFYLTFRITYIANQSNRTRKEIDELVRGFKMP